MLLSLITKFKVYLIIAGVVGSVLMVQQLRIMAKDKTIKRQNETITLQAASIRTFELALKESETEIDKLKTSIEEDRKLKDQREKRYKEIETELAHIRSKYENVKKYLDTAVPEQLNGWLRKTYGNYTSKNNKTRTTKRIFKRHKKAGVHRHKNRRFAKLHKRTEQGYRSL
jgi:DNA repair exonuclease SbcCD ATPase subunit